MGSLNTPATRLPSAAQTEWEWYGSFVGDCLPPNYSPEKGSETTLDSGYRWPVVALEGPHGDMLNLAPTNEYLLRPAL